MTAQAVLINTRKRLIILLSAVIVIFNIYILAFMPLSAFRNRGVFMIVFIMLAVLLKPPKSKTGISILAIFALMALAGTIYPMIFGQKIAANFYVASGNDFYFFVIFTVGLVGILTRVGGGIITIALLGLMILYLLFGEYIGGLWGHAHFSKEFIATLLYTDIDQGAFGTFTETMSRLVCIFMVFATLLVSSGLGELFTAIACWLTGGATGGPAKVSVFSSALFGMLSGSPVANVAATGSFSIPLMKKVGYRPEVAATIEALSATGGNLMPPVMGVAAFLMADLLGIPYSLVCFAAIIPTSIWYFTCYSTVHYYALGHKIIPWRPSRDDLMKVIKAKYHLLIAPIALVVALIYFAASPEQAALFSVVFLLILTNVRKETRLNKEKVLKFLKEYAEMVAPLFVLVIALGMFISAMMGSGSHLKLGQLVFGGVTQWYVIIAIGAAFTIVLGMVLPITAAYLGSVTVLAPVLVGMGYNPIVVHMFVLYLATLAPLTPPVAMASYTAARIAGTDPMKTSLETTIRGLPLWIVPFYLFRKELFFGIGVPISAIGIGVAILFLGTFIFILGVEGHFRRRLNLFERILAVVIGLSIVQPVSDVISQVFVGIGILFLAFWMVSGKGKQIHASKPWTAPTVSSP